MAKPEVMIVAFGSAAQMGLPSLSRIAPVWELVVADMEQKYNGTLHFSYKYVPARNCLAAAEKNDDILARWYYTLRQPGRVLVFINTGVESGKTNCHVHRNFLFIKWLSTWILAIEEI